MSDESAASPKTSSAAAAPRARRISNPRPKKKAKTASAKGKTPEPATVADTPEASKFPEFSESQEAAVKPDASAPDGEWPEAEAASSGTSATPENPKRKRRRKKGKGNGGQNAPAPVEGDNPPQAVEEAAASSSSKSQAQVPRPPQQARPKLDSEMLAKFAWKIYLAEISEEGVALVGDNDAKELSRRCFRLAEIFMEEQTRRR